LQIELSIIVHTFNASRYAWRFVKDLTSQLSKFSINPDFFEIVVVDGGSTDNTQVILDDLLKKYKVRHRVIVTSPNAYDVSSSRNLGIDLASGKWIAFSDIDDVPILYAFKKAISIGEINGCEVVAGNMIILDETIKSGKIIKNFNRVEFLKGKAVLRHMLGPLGEMDLRFQAMVIRSEFIKKWGIRFHPGAISHEDFEFVSKVLFYARKVCLVPYVLYVYRYSPKSIRCKRILDGLRTLLRVQEFLSRNEEIDLSKLMEFNILKDLQILLKLILLKKMFSNIEVDNCTILLAQRLEKTLKKIFIKYILQVLVCCITQPKLSCIKRFLIEVTYLLLLSLRIRGDVFKRLARIYTFIKHYA